MPDPTPDFVLPRDFPTLPKKRPEVLARATFLVRERLLDDVESLVARRHLEPTVAAGLAPRFGYKSQVDDVLALVSIYRTHWAAIAKATRLRQDDLAHAETLATELRSAFAPSLWSRRRRHASAQLQGSADDSSRAHLPAVADERSAVVVEIGDCVISMEIGPANDAPSAPSAGTSWAVDAEAASSMPSVSDAATPSVPGVALAA